MCYRDLDRSYRLFLEVYMKKIIFIFLACSMLLGVMATLGACKSEASIKMEENLEKGRKALEDFRKIEKP